VEEIKPLFVRPIEAAVLIRASKSKIYELIQRGDLPSVRIGGLLRIPYEAIAKLAVETTAKSRA